MFNNYFVRVSLDLLKKESDFLLEQGLNPEVYIESWDLEQLANQELADYTTLISRFSANTIHAPFLDIYPGSFRPEEREAGLEKLLQVLRIASIWNSILVVIHVKYDPLAPTGFFPLWLENTAGFISRLLQGSKDIKIALENISEPTPVVANKLKQMVNSSRVIDCVDIGHHNVFAELPLDKWLLLLKQDHHIHFHFHDNWGDFDDHLAVGKGNVNWDFVKQVILGLDTDFSVTLESHSKKNLIKTVKNYKKLFLDKDIVFKK